MSGIVSPRCARKVVLGLAFGAGVLIGGVYVAYATAHDLFDRFIR